MRVDDFRIRIGNCAVALKQVKTPVRVLSHLDSDGISAAAIIIRALTRLGLPYTAAMFPQLTEKDILRIPKSTQCIFCDFGSAHTKLISEHFEKQAFVVDHHVFSKPYNLHFMNPHEFGIDGSKDISSSGIAFMFSRELDLQNQDMAHIALVGAIGDCQYRFSGLNKEILEIAKSKNLVEESRGIRFFGRQSRALHKLLAYSSGLYIPGVSGSEKEAVGFLKDIGISPKKAGKWRMIADLTSDEKKKLIASIIRARLSEVDPKDIYAEVLEIPGEQGVYSDAQEFSVVLNACGRLGKSSVGVGICLGDPKMKEKGKALLMDYRRELVGAMNWIHKERKNPQSVYVIDHKSFLLINAKDRIPSTMIGTIASLLTKSEGLCSNEFVIAMAENTNGTIKVSLRKKEESKADLHSLILNICREISLEAGGHKGASGALIPQGKEQILVDNAKHAFKMASMEEDLG